MTVDPDPPPGATPAQRPIVGLPHLLASEPAPPAAPKGEPRPWWESRAFVAAMIALAFVPLLYPPVPPLVDLLGHMGRYRVELDVGSSPDLQRYYSFQWHLIGNLGVDLLIVPLAKLVGLEMAVKLIAMSIPPLTVAGFLWVAREVHNRLPPTAALALPFALSHPFLFGFLNYTLAMALAFLAFALWLRLGRLGKTRLRAILFVPISFLLFVCHTFGWGTLGLLCFSAEAVRQHDKGISWWRAALKAALHALVMAGPVVLMLVWRSDVAGAPTHGWFNWVGKGQWVAQALRDRWQWIDIAILVAIGLCGLLALATRWFTLSRNLAFSAMVLAVAFVLLPWTVFGSAYADMRLAPFVLAVIVLGIRTKSRPPFTFASVLAVVATSVFVAKVAITATSLAIASDRQDRQLAALDLVPRGAALVYLVGQPCTTIWPLFRESHLGAMAIVRRHAFSNDQWAIDGANLLTVHYRPAGHFRADPSQMVSDQRCRRPKSPPVDLAMRAIPRSAFAYVWLVDVPRFDPASLAGYREIWRGEGSALYAKSSPAAKEAP
ncbi:hypothetical protein [Sphingomonas sp.]|uniref:hypothetical protein n=1 Tax=Sphingomonas sp. TaxID=28214 RepID=UPI00286C54A3|nr:hypothetical protein [Sphingomonas sp.]